MKNKEFKQYIIKEASKYFDGKPVIKTNKQKKQIKENDYSKDITPKEIKQLVKEMRKINKRIDLREPLIKKEFFEKIKKTDKNQDIINEEYKQRWKDLYNYSVPTDEKRQ